MIFIIINLPFFLFSSLAPSISRQLHERRVGATLADYGNARNIAVEPGKHAGHPLQGASKTESLRAGCTNGLHWKFGQHFTGRDFHE
jgi:hypothetical protein